MAEKWQIGEVFEFQVGETPCWQVNLIKPDGAIVAHVMPKSILDSRAAEFGIDPTDVDTLMDIILHENHIPMIDDPVTGPRPADGGVDLKSAENTTQAREAQQARLKNARVKFTVKGNPALDKIRSSHKPDPVRIRALKEHIDTKRWVAKYGKLPDPPELKEPSAAQQMGRALGITVTIPDLSRE